MKKGVKNRKDVDLLYLKMLKIWFRIKNMTLQLL